MSVVLDFIFICDSLKDIVKIGAVDMTEHQSVGVPYNIQGFPTIKIFGANKQSPQDYQGNRVDRLVLPFEDHEVTLKDGRDSFSVSFLNLNVPQILVMFNFKDLIFKCSTFLYNHFQLLTVLLNCFW